MLIRVSPNLMSKKVKMGEHIVDHDKLLELDDLKLEFLETITLSVLQQGSIKSYEGEKGSKTLRDYAEKLDEIHCNSTTILNERYGLNVETDELDTSCRKVGFKNV